MGRSWRNFFRRKKDTPEQQPEIAAKPEENSDAESAAPEEAAEPPASTGATGERGDSPRVVRLRGLRREEEVEDEPQSIEETVPEPEPEPEQAETPEVSDTFDEEEAVSEPAAFRGEPDGPESADELVEDQEESAGGWFSRLRSGLARSRESVVGQLNAAVAEFRDADDEEFWERVEEVLIASDVGVPTTAKLVAQLEQEALQRNITSGKELRELLIEKATAMLEGPVELDISHSPTVLLMVGVNGTGKTTTIGKLARFLPVDNIMFAAGDTFRAAAIEQLQTWGERTGTPVIARQRGADSAAVAHDAVEEAKAAGTDVLLIDTAGRLHTKSNLMAELDKVKRVIGRQLPDAPHEVLLSIDATTGQNGLRQAKMFSETAGVTGVVLTKLDGTAKGGIALAIANEVGVPIKLISVGEKVEDLHPFDARQFAEALFGDL